MLLAKLGWKSCDGRHFQQLAILSRTPKTLDTMCTFVVERRCVFWRRFQERVWYKLLILYPDIYSKAKAIAFLHFGCFIVFCLLMTQLQPRFSWTPEISLQGLPGEWLLHTTADASLTASRCKAKLTEAVKSVKGCCRVLPGCSWFLSSLTGRDFSLLCNEMQDHAGAPTLKPFWPRKSSWVLVTDMQDGKLNFHILHYH